MELSREGGVAVNHPFHVIERKVVGVLPGRIVPSNEVKITVNSCVLELLSITNNSVKVPFRGRYEICVVHENSPR